MGIWFEKTSLIRNVGPQPQVIIIILVRNGKKKTEIKLISSTQTEINKVETTPSTQRRFARSFSREQK